VDQTRTNEELVAAHRAGDRRALGDLVKQNQGLIVRFAQRYSGAPFEDLKQEGVLGVLRAVADFDLTLGKRFSTYAAWWIRSHLLQLVYRNAHMVALGNTRGRRKAFSQIARTRSRLDAIGAPTSAKDLAASMGVKLEEVEALTAGREPNVDLLDESVLHDPATRPDEVLEREDERERRLALLRRYRRRLAPRDRLIFDGRFGGDEQRTLVDLAVEMGVSRERVRQIEVRMLDDLRQAADAMLAAEEAEAA
jgi:RNA polymerase sigma-32 factor